MAGQGGGGGGGGAASVQDCPTLVPVITNVHLTPNPSQSQINKGGMDKKILKVEFRRLPTLVLQLPTMLL